MASELSPVELPFLAALATSVRAVDRQLWLRVAADYLTLASEAAPARDAVASAAIAALGQSDEATRSAFARRLAPHAGAGATLAALEALGGEAALVILAEAATLPRERLMAAATGEATSAARAVAQRVDLDAALVGALIARDEIDVTLTLARNQRAPIDAGQFAALARLADARRSEASDRRLTNALLERTPAGVEHAALFFEADTGQRARIIAAAQRATLGRRFPAALSPDAAAIAARLERRALEGDWRGFASALAEDFDCTEALATRIAGDVGGEPLALALAALGAPADASVRILAARDLHEGRDYRRIAALARLKDAMNPAAARLTMAAMIGAGAPAPAQHRPHYDPTAQAAPSRPAPNGRRDEATVATSGRAQPKKGSANGAR